MPQTNNVFFSKKKLTNKDITKNKGFTLIELLIVVMTIGIITLFGVASYSSFNERQKVEQAAREVLINLRMVQSNSVNGKKEGCVNNILDGWCVNINNEYYDKCGLVKGSFHPLLDSKWKNDVILSSFTKEFCFRPVYGDPFDPNDVNNPINITMTVLSKNDNNIKKVITINQTGVISLTD